jgi:hypothetical protein
MLRADPQHPPATIFFAAVALGFKIYAAPAAATLRHSRANHQRAVYRIRLSIYVFHFSYFQFKFWYFLYTRTASDLFIKI